MPIISNFYLTNNLTTIDLNVPSKISAIVPNKEENIIKHHNTQRAVIAELMFRYTIGVRIIMTKDVTLVLEPFFPKICNM